MKYSKTYKFQEWNNWDHTIADAIDDFFDTFHLYPHILLCNKFTFSQIDFITTINPEKREHASPVDEFLNKEEINLAAFIKGPCELEFGVEVKLEIGAFSLVFDDEADWGDDDDEKFLPVDEVDVLKGKVLV